MFVYFPRALLVSSALSMHSSITSQNRPTSQLLGILMPSLPGGSSVATVLPVSLSPLTASSKVPSVTTETWKRSSDLGWALLASSQSCRGISSGVPVRTAATARGSCRGGPAVMPKTSLDIVSTFWDVVE